MTPGATGWNRFLPDILDSFRDKTIQSRPRTRIGVDACIVPSPDKGDLIVAVPVLITRDIFEEIGLDRSSSPGAVHAIIEEIKSRATDSPGLFLLHGGRDADTFRYASHCEPCTIAHSPRRIATHLWRPDERNRAVPGGIQLLLRGSLPYMPPDPVSVQTMQDHLQSYAERSEILSLE